MVMMLDWDNLYKAGPGQAESQKSGFAEHLENTESLSECPGVPVTHPECPGQHEHDNDLNYKDNNCFVPAVPAVPEKNTRDGKEIMEISRDGGVAAEKFRGRKHRMNALAAVLAVAYCESVGASNEEIMAALSGLRRHPSGDQFRIWWNACLGGKLDPWKELHGPTLGEGMECGSCKHIDSVASYVAGTRRRFHWSCKLGYMIHEHGYALERVLIAPPECQSWEQWAPSR